MKATLKQITVPQLQVGNIAHFHGAVFEIISVTDVTSHHRNVEKGEMVVSAKAKWLSGEVVNCYFGPTLDWTFQGNSSAVVMIEA